jgi:hypothetical protein
MSENGCVYRCLIGNPKLKGRVVQARDAGHAEQLKGRAARLPFASGSSCVVVYADYVITLCRGPLRPRSLPEIRPRPPVVRRCTRRGHFTCCPSQAMDFSFITGTNGNMDVVSPTMHMTGISSLPERVYTLLRLGSRLDPPPKR